MEKEKNVDVGLLINKLSYSWATPEAEDFHYKVKFMEYDDAIKMLKKEGLNKNEANAVLNYFKKQMTTKKQIVLCAAEIYEEFKNEDKILVSFGGRVYSTQVIYDEKMTKNSKKYFMDNNYGFIELEKAIQIWKIIDCE